MKDIVYRTIIHLPFSSLVCSCRIVKHYTTMILIVQVVAIIIIILCALFNQGTESFSPTYYYSSTTVRRSHRFHCSTTTTTTKTRSTHHVESTSFSWTRLYEKKKEKSNTMMAKDDDYMVLLQEDEGDDNSQRRNSIINLALGSVVTVFALASWDFYRFTLYTPDGFTRISPTRFIAALGNPSASEGTAAAKTWGVWRVDPGPRGVWLKDYQRELQDTNGIAPRGWRFDARDFWIEEHGLIMESPTFPLPAGRYLVTGGRAVTTGLTIDESGNWKLDDGTLYDVTHLPCRAARYKPAPSSSSAAGVAIATGSPAAARLTDFPVAPGATMPSIPGTSKQDYAVLFIIGKATTA